MTQGVVIDFNANVTRFTSALDKATNDLSKFQSHSKRVSSGIGKAFTGLGAGLSVAAFGAIIKNSIEAADKMTKLSQSTGITVESLSALSFAGKLSGVETEALGSAMVKMTKGMADAAAGTGEAMRGYEALGIQIKDANGNLKNSDVVLNEVADKFAGMEDGANKTALAVSLFGKSGAAMVPLLDQGSKGINAMKAEALELGLVIDKKFGQSAERFDDNLTRLHAVGSGFSNQIAAELLPTLEKMTESLISTAKSTDGFGKTAAVAASGVKLLWTSGSFVVATFETLGDTLGGVAATLVQLFSGNFKQALDTAGATYSSAVDNVSSEIMSISKIWEDEAAKVEGNADAIGKKLAAPMMKSLEEINKVKGAQKKASDAALAEIKKMAADAQRIIFDIDPVAKAGESWNKLQMLVSKGFLTQEQAVLSYKKQFDTSQEEMKASAQEAQGIIFDIDPIAKAGAEWEKLQNLVVGGFLTQEQAQLSYIKTFGDGTDTMTTMAEEAGKNIQDAFAQFLFDPFKDGVGGMLQGFSVMVRKMAAEAASAKLLESLGNWGKSNSGGGLVGGLASAASSLFGKRADGGPVSSGKSYLVGERGPEIFTPNGSGNITPNGGIGGGSISIVNNFTVSGSVDRATQDQIAMRAGMSIRMAQARNG